MLGIGSMVVDSGLSRIKSSVVASLGMVGLILSLMFRWELNREGWRITDGWRIIVDVIVISV